ncbi:MAG: BMC domain-containing protein [Myxococcales bacterium]|nr:BMC domain-containing protein [Myxococcales bacterium]
MSAADSSVGPALAMLAIGAVPLGLVALDALAKEAPVDVLAAGTVESGLYLIAFAGEVEPCLRAYAAARRVAAAALEDQILLPYAEERIVPAFVGGVRRSGPGDTVGVVETLYPPTLLAALDAALKGAEVELVELRVGDGLGGKAVATLGGATHDVEAALALAARALVRGRSEGSSTTIVPNADGVVGQALRSGSRFCKEWRG